MTQTDFLDRNALWMATSNGHNEIVQKLITHAKISGQLNEMASVLGGENRVTTVYRAVQKKRHKCLRLLINAGVNLNDDRLAI